MLKRSGKSKNPGDDGDHVDKAVSPSTSDSYEQSEGTAEGPDAGAPTAPPTPSATPAQLDPVAELQGRVRQLEEALLRAKADFQNLQRRSANERMEAVHFGNAELMKSLLGVLDDLERSVQAAESPQNHEKVIEGLRLVHANLTKTLRGFGLDAIPALRERFDPLIHEALLQQPSASLEPGTVMEEVAKGYRLRERVLRPAKVIVAKAAEPTPEHAAAGENE